MYGDATTPDPTAAGYRQKPTTRVQVGLALLAVPALLTGVWAVFAPSSWYSDYGTDLAPPSAFGQYNEHFVQDLGSGYLGIGAVLAFAALWPRREAVRIALIGFLVFTIPHLVVHIVERGELDDSGYFFTVGLLLFGCVVAAWVWLLNEKANPSIETGTGAARA